MLMLSKWIFNLQQIVFGSFSVKTMMKLRRNLFVKEWFMKMKLIVSICDNKKKEKHFKGTHFRSFSIFERNLSHFAV